MILTGIHRLQNTPPGKATAATYMIVSMTMMAIVAACAKKLVETIPVIDILLMQYIFMTAITCLLGRPPAISVDTALKLILRSIITLAGAYYMYRALALSPVTLVLAVFYTYPIITLILFRIFHKTHLRLIDLFSIAGSFLAVLIILNPYELKISAFLALITSVCVAARTLIDRHLLIREQSSQSIQFYVYLFSSIILLFVWIINKDQYSDEYMTNIHTLHILLLAALSVLVVSAQVLTMTVIKYGEIKIYAILGYWEVVASIPLGMLIFSQPLEIRMLFGVALLLLFGALPHISTRDT